MSREITSGFADFGQLELSAEPRSAWNNSAVNARNQVSEGPWYGFYAAISQVNDALIAIDSGLVIGDASRTARAKAVGKFVQGISHGYLGLYFDSAYVADEKLALDTLKTPRFTPYPAVITAAITQLDSAIAVSTANTFTLPVDSWLFTTTTSAQLARLSNSFARAPARLLAAHPRRARRRELDRGDPPRRRGRDDRLRSHRPARRPVGRLEAPGGAPAHRRTPERLRAPELLAHRAGRFHQRLHQLGQHPAGEPAAVPDAHPRSPHQGATGPTSPGRYMGYNLNNIFAVARGTWRYSHYYFHRFGTGETWQSGPLTALTVTEMDLLKAEALIRLGRAGEAVPLINKSRVANGQLPPVTVEGPPNEPGCVPRKLNGQCGSLWDALRYEKGIEMLGVSGVISFFDARGWQTLPENSLQQLPVPGRELGTLRLPLYTYGGPGGKSITPAPDPERCPVALARCP
jgi:hypothetical protein